MDGARCSWSTRPTADSMKHYRAVVKMAIFVSVPDK